MSDSKSDTAHTPPLTFEHLAALYEIVEAARREFYDRDFDTDRRSERERQLQLAYRAITHIAEHFPFSGEVPARLQPLSYVNYPEAVSRALQTIMNLRSRADMDNDPWWMDTLRLAPDVLSFLSPAQLDIVIAEMRRFGLVVQVDTSIEEGAGEWSRTNDPVLPL